MAPTSSLFPALLISILHCLLAQTNVDLSATFPSLDPPSQTPPNKLPAGFWPSLSPKGRSDVPIRVRDRSVTPNVVEQGQRTHSTPFTSVLSTQNIRSGPVETLTTSFRARTDTARLAFSRDFPKRDTNKNPFLPTVPLIADEAPVRLTSTTAGIADELSVTNVGSNDSQGLGSGSSSSAAEDGMAQYRPQPHTALSTVSDAKPSVKPRLFALNTTSTTSTVSTTLQTTRTSPLPGVTLQKTQTEELTEVLTANQVTLARPTPTQSSDDLLQTAGPLGSAPNQRRPHSNVTTLQETATPTVIPITQETGRVPLKTKGHLSQTAQLEQRDSSTSARTPRPGDPSFLATTFLPVTKARFSTTHRANVNQRNRTHLLGHPQRPPPHTTSKPSPSPSTQPIFNGTLLYWGDLSRTLSFAWELHVYGTASLFLLLFAGAALGLTLSPGTNCPHRGALALANAFLFLAGGFRATLFFIDPYGTRNFLPHSAVAALYNLPLHLLVWTLAALALLSLRVSGVNLLPSALERPPLIAVLAVLQCTLLLAADLFSSALSPVVPVTLQVLSLCWGLALCLGFLCFVFPRTRYPPVPQIGAPVDVRRKVWTGNARTGLILGRVLSVCAVLGTLCCGLHAYATLWLYGILGDWTHFSWGWWLVHFWARLLELAWGFFLLLMGSWLFWRPRNCSAQEEGSQLPRTTGDLTTTSQSVNSCQRHTCWSKIVQSLKGKPCRKSDSNGMGGGGSGPGLGDVPNNCGGQERPGADISKSLIRNQNLEQSTAQTRCVKDSNRGRNPRGHSAERGLCDDSSSSLLKLPTLGRPPQRSTSGSLDQDRDHSLSFYEFDLRPPSPIDLTRSIDEALHREHLLEGGSLFHPLSQTSPGSGISQGPWLRRTSDPQLLSDSSDDPTESSMPLGGSILSSVPSRQVTAPPTPSHQGHRWVANGVGSVPSSVSCPVSLRPSRMSSGQLCDDGVDDTRPFITPDSERVRGRPGKPAGSRSYLEVSRHDDSASVSSEIIDL
ncbi:proline-rich transmembrane protein 3 [Gouania willdenowi]|uniref:Proline-rich transmembrane protein 3/4 domain-containing protein n=1 Tax=Gouania willdenowi TaxID=441366 RepID=A0A8C5HAQ4_GOUWI|nr:proline-rich transmembrane protein 3 [Gouania willdenowi]